MEYEDDAQLVNFISGMMLGIVIGAGVAVLLAPASGRKTRKRLKKAARNVRSETSDRWEDLAGEMKVRVDDAVHGARKRFT